ncbi:hypothetical protein Glove_213g34 [Diversispora epigaea]|uniref:Uncharacterized protein n=1 Tax=Diversispora epigaea TaxID=1348612 RepID=A0A397IHL3_9GLOM|nr:hypothetical protein Glove_213g34 [Diversispora epigaea]
MSIRIYTDGSLIKNDNNSSHVTTMGCGWYALDENDTEFNFSSKVKNFASSTCAELMAILTAVYATPKRSRLSIEEIANVQNLTLRLEKVKVHSEVIHNETADKLAREGCFKPVCFTDLQSLTSVNAVSCWNTETIEEPLRHFTKKLDNKETRQRAFNVKLFNNELPTLEKLKDRFPKIYENDSLSKTTIVACGNTCKNMCRTLETLKELHIPRDVSMRDADHLSFIDVMLGLIPITVYDIVLQKVVTHELADQIMDDVFNQFKLFLHTHIWKDRCTAVKKWETENGISNNK